MGKSETDFRSQIDGCGWNNGNKIRAVHDQKTLVHCGVIGGHEIVYTRSLPINGQPSSDELVVRHIGVELPKNPQLQAIIAADKAVPHGDVIHVIDLVKRSGVHKFAISTDREPAGR